MSILKYRSLGKSGLRVSPLCLGATMFGSEIEEGAADRLIGQAYDAGVNFIDTADSYGSGLSENVVGKAIKSNRNSWIVGTKVADPMGSGPNDRGLTRRYIRQAAEASLRRLGTDRIDIYYLHREDHSTPLEQTVAAIADLIRQGKILYFGVCNYRAWRLAEICRLCGEYGIANPIASQSCYNILNRMPEVEHLPACLHFGIGAVPYSPLARGVLTGKYPPDGPPPTGSRAERGDSRMMQTEWRRESLEIAQKIKLHAETRGISAAQFALSWVLNNRAASATIAGPRTLEQWDHYLAGLNYQFTSEDEDLVDQLVAAGHPSTPGYNDPRYPIEGRTTFTGSDRSQFHETGVQNAI